MRNDGRSELRSLATVVAVCLLVAVAGCAGMGVDDDADGIGADAADDEVAEEGETDTDDPDTDAEDADDADDSADDDADFDRFEDDDHSEDADGDDESAADDRTDDDGAEATDGPDDEAETPTETDDDFTDSDESNDVADEGDDVADDDTSDDGALDDSDEGTSDDELADEDQTDDADDTAGAGDDAGDADEDGPDDLDTVTTEVETIDVDQGSAVEAVVSGERHEDAPNGEPVTFEVTTDPESWPAEVDVSPGTYDVEIESEGYIDETLEAVALEDEGPGIYAELYHDLDDVEIEFLVEDEGGEPIEGAEVSLMRIYPSQPDDEQLPTATTDADGTATATMAEGGIDVGVEADGYYVGGTFVETWEDTLETIILESEDGNDGSEDEPVTDDGAEDGADEDDDSDDSADDG
ncbi:hypothetical protein [Natronorarus salvus]|uniref:hypothetical protein n=1 Tax=Natronorarus salvus TaxID=3117733 RepID=UPI002F2666BB